MARRFYILSRPGFRKGAIRDESGREELEKAVVAPSPGEKNIELSKFYFYINGLLTVFPKNGHSTHLFVLYQFIWIVLNGGKWDADPLYAREFREDPSFIGMRSHVPIAFTGKILTI